MARRLGAMWRYWTGDPECDRVGRGYLERRRIASDLDELLGEGPFVFPMPANVMWAVRT